jgi:DNA-binding CsgD family transcriptional regulator
MDRNIIPFPGAARRRKRRMKADAVPLVGDVARWKQRELDQAVASRVLDQLQRAVLVTDADAVVLYANGRAAELLRRGDALVLVVGRLSLTSRRADTALGRFLGLSDSEGALAHEPLVLNVPRSNGLPSYQLLATRLEGAERPMEGPSQRFLFFLYEPHASRAVSTRILVQLYGLSAAEARLASKLFQCCSLQETARSLNISLGTAKTHLKHIFAKCEVRSQAELLQLLALGPRSCV